MKIPLLLLFGCTASAYAHDIQSLEMSRPEGARHYFLVRPGQVAPDGPAGAKLPLVVLLHGHSGSAKQLLGQGIGAAPLSAWLDIADRDGVLLIVPDGTKGIDDKQGWNDCRADAPFNPRTDDLGFITALIDEAIASLGVDPRRIYAMGMSNGGMMALRLAVERPHRLAAVAAVGASMPVKSACKAAATPVSVMLFAGDADPLVPYAGGEVRFGTQASRGALLGIEDTLRIWRELDQLPGHAAISMRYDHRAASGATSARRSVWGGDPAGNQVALIRIEGGGHVEPSETHRIGDLYRAIVGPQNADLESADEAWAFFRSKRRAPPAATGSTPH